MRKGISKKRTAGKEGPGWGNPFDRGLTVTRCRMCSPKLTGPLRLVILSDLHGTVYGEGQRTLAELVRRQRPDLILMPGDMADDRRPVEGTLQLLEAISGLCPAFYVSGNHEEWTGRTRELARLFEERGVTVLAGDCAEARAAGQRLQVGGVSDPHAFTASHHTGRLDERWKRQLRRCCSRLRPNCFGILLSHRPEPVAYYRDCGFDLVVSGHAHGGQVRLPGLAPGGLLAPHQGLFPRYAGGMYELGAARLAVSRGLCLNRLPRIWNPPEVVLVEAGPAPPRQ